MNEFMNRKHTFALLTHTMLYVVSISIVYEELLIAASTRIAMPYSTPGYLLAVHACFQNKPDATTTLPLNHAGHHTSQTTTCVHIPHTCHPSAALTSTCNSSTLPA